MIKLIRGIKTMRSEAITSENVASIDWDEGYFKYCDFENFAIEGKVVDSEFVGCTFKGIDWYMGLFTHSNFINCKILDSQFSGTSFPDTRFVDCEFVNCQFKEDNIGRACDFSKTIAYGCTIENCAGLDLASTSPTPPPP
jgi:uncharacterized protein YjbI with pentapeptide repeats